MNASESLENAPHFLRLPSCSSSVFTPPKFVPFMSLRPSTSEYSSRVKSIIKEAYKNKLPQFIINRKKVPFPVQVNKINDVIKEKNITYEPDLIDSLSHKCILRMSWERQEKLLYISYLDWYKKCKNILTH